MNATHLISRPRVHFGEIYFEFRPVDCVAEVRDGLGCPRNGFFDGWLEFFHMHQSPNVYIDTTSLGREKISRG